MNNSLFGATNIAKNIDKEKYVYSGYVITFDSAGLCNFDNDFTRNVIIFGGDNSSLAVISSWQSQEQFLILGVDKNLVLVENLDY